MSAPGQAVYNLGANPGQPGLLLDNERSNQRIVTVPSSVVVPPGVLCETTTANGKLVSRPCQDTGTTTTFLPNLCGISVLDTVSVEQLYTTYAVPASGGGSTWSGYPVGYPVPFLKRGGIWGSWDGNTSTALPLEGGIQVWHSSTTNAQGVFTTKAAQTTVGSEIDGPFAYVQVWDPDAQSGAYTDSFGGTIDIVALEINLPGHS